MQSFLSKLAGVGVIVGGFAATGDLRGLVDHGTRLVNATTVPVDAEAEPASPPPGPVPQPAYAVQAVPAVQPVQPAPAAPAAAAEARDAPIGHPVAAARLPVSTLESLDVRTLVPGKRLAVWVGTPPVLVAFDVVDPAAGEVLEQQLAQAGGAPHAIPRRVRLEGDAARPRQIVRGGSLRLSPLGIAHGASPAGPTETLGPVRAIQIE